jgi:hypothetical protein
VLGRRIALAHALAVGVVLGCASGKPYAGGVPEPNAEQFQTSVYPMLLRNCAFSNCHGEAHRFFQVLGPGRNRLDPKQMPGDPATAAEIALAYDRARSMLITGTTLGDSLLLRKPLEASQGGEGHRGVDSAGRNVFASRSDPDYVLLVQWAFSRNQTPATTAATGKP